MATGFALGLRGGLRRVDEELRAAAHAQLGGEHRLAGSNRRGVAPSSRFRVRTMPELTLVRLVRWGGSCLLTATACTAVPSVGPSAPLNQQFTLPRGGIVSIDGTSMRLQFVEVSGDSRCPADVVCIQAGDATVHLRALDDGAAADYMVHTGDSARAAATHRQLRIELLQLAPYPFSTRTIAQDDYRATLKVTAP